MNKILNMVWIVLVALTVFAFLVGKLALSSSLVVGLLLVTTFIKGKLVIDYFMDLHALPNRWKNFPTVWLGLVLLVIGGFYFMGI